MAYVDSIIIPEALLPEITPRALQTLREEREAMYSPFFYHYTFVQDIGQVFESFEAGYSELDIPWADHHLDQPGGYGIREAINDLCNDYAKFHININRAFSFLRYPPLGIELEFVGVEITPNNLAVLKLSYLDHKDNQFHGPGYDLIVGGEYGRQQSEVNNYDGRKTIYSPV